MFGKALLACNGVNASEPTVDLTNGLVAHYLLNNNADDCYGIYDGTVANEVLFDGEMSEYDGVNDVIEVSTYDATREYESMTISAWVKLDDFADTSGIYGHLYATVSGASQSSGVELSVAPTTGIPRLACMLPVDEEYTDSLGNVYNTYARNAYGTETPLTIGKLHHLVGVVNANSSYLYLDGVLVCSATTVATHKYNLYTTRMGVSIGGLRYYDLLNNYYHKTDGKISNLRVYNVAHDQAFVTALYEEGYYPKPLPLPTTGGLIAYYPLTGTAEDSTGNYDGTENGVTYVDDNEFGSVASFDGASKIAYPTLGLGAEFTFNFWINSNDVTQDQRCCYNDELDDIFIINRIINSKLGLYIQDSGGGNTTESVTTLIDNTWYMGTFVYRSSGKSELYLDGVFENDITTSVFESLGKQFGRYIGSEREGTGVFVDGEIKNYRVYNRTLNQQEITDIYNYEKNFRSIDIDDGLVAYYPLKQNSIDNYYNGYDGVDIEVVYDGESADFDGESSKITIDSPLIAGTASRFSISCWMSANSIHSGRGVYLNNGDDTNYLFISFHNTGEIKVTSNLCTQITADSDFSLGEMYHVVFTYDSTAGGVLVLNTEVAGTGTPEDDLTENLKGWVGVDNAGTYVLDGKVSRVRVYNKLLTTEQIQVIYNTEKANFE